MKYPLYDAAKQYPLFNSGNQYYSQAQLNKIYNVKGLEFLATPPVVMKNENAYAPLYVPNEAEKKHQTFEMGVINDLPMPPPELFIDNVEPTSADWDELNKPSKVIRRGGAPLPNPVIQEMENAYEREMAKQNEMFEAFELAKDEKIQNEMGLLRARGYTETEIADIIKKRRADEALTMMKQGTLRVGTVLDRPTERPAFTREDVMTSTRPLTAEPPTTETPSSKPPAPPSSAASTIATDPRSMTVAGAGLSMEELGARQEATRRELINKAVATIKNSTAEVKNIANYPNISNLTPYIPGILRDNGVDVPEGLTAQRKAFIRLVQSKKI